MIQWQEAAEVIEHIAVELKTTHLKQIGEESNGFEGILPIKRYPEINCPTIGQGQVQYQTGKMKNLTAKIVTRQSMINIW